jgi:hypothetical protein
MLAQQKAEAEKKDTPVQEALNDEGEQFSQKNTSIDQSELYSGISLVQLKDHDNDSDDFVPELNEDGEVSAL